MLVLVTPDPSPRRAFVATRLSRRRRRSLRGGPGAGVAVCAALLFLTAVLRAIPASSSETARPRLLVADLPEGLRLDGLLDEPAWAAAPAIEDLSMVEPRQGDAPTGRTVVRALAGPKAVVFGLRCFDPDAPGIVSFTKERDGDLESEDHVLLVLDTFQDGRSGYVFAVNPGGARFDALVQPGGEDVDSNWDGEWEAVVLRDAEGWTAEIRIPVETLSFKRGLTEWGFNVQRRVQRLQETDRWAGAQQDYSVFQASRAGLLAGLPAFDLGLGVGLRPSLRGGFQKASPDAASEGTLEPSLDLTQRLGPNALASLTVNTDFAEAEVDTRQTNLTRFPSFFPEKRTFFLDAADTFSFGTGIGEESLLPFFSRRIGLVEDQEVPILAGLKATGRFGETNVGALVVRTREQMNLAPATTLAVLRAKQNLFAESRAGILATLGDPLGRPGSWELGADFTYQTSSFQGDRNFSAGVWLLAVGREGLQQGRERTAFGFKLDYPNDRWDCLALYRRIGDGFDPSLGFVPRRGINTYQAGCTFAPRPPGGVIRQMFHRFHPLLVTDLSGRRESYSVPITPIDWQFESGDRVEFNLAPTGERLSGPFEVVDGLNVAPGSYDWRRWEIEVETASKRKLAARAAWTFGGFYTGRLQQFELEAAWTPSPLVTLLAELEHSAGHLPEGRFDLTIVGTKVRLNLSPNLQLDSFVQYDTEDGTFGTNTRLRWTFHRRGNLFAIYNHNLRDLDGRWQRDSNRLLVKLEYTFRR